MQGGKSGAQIFVTPDSRYIIKILKPKEIGLLDDQTMKNYY